MSVEQTETVDFITVDKSSGDICLTISDHLPWDSDEGTHLLMLQNKLNSYLRFIESGEMIEQYPKAKGRRAVINLVGKFPLSDEASRFFNLAREQIERTGYRLQFSLLRPN
jgi:hypothetical protein